MLEMYPLAARVHIPAVTALCPARFRIWQPTSRHAAWSAVLLGQPFVARKDHYLRSRSGKALAAPRILKLGLGTQISARVIFVRLDRKIDAPPSSASNFFRIRTYTKSGMGGTCELSRQDLGLERKSRTICTCANTAPKRRRFCTYIKIGGGGCISPASEYAA
jgi:hypothetical protein